MPKFEVVVYDKSGRKIVSEVREASHKAHAVVQVIYSIEEWRMDEEPAVFKIEARKVQG
ncbi:MAG: hypothetical protein QXT64_02830 [Desulfurococcaceae archaeon]